MDYITVTAKTWTKISDATSNVVIVQSLNANNRAFRFSFGEPNEGEVGFEEKDTLILNAGTLGQELWVYSSEGEEFCAQGVV